MIPKPSPTGARHCVDVFVFCTWASRRWLLMVDRRDCLGWAVPGGGVKPGEFPDAAAARALEEETGRVLGPDASWQVLDARQVPDPRGPVVTVPFVHHMGYVEHLPALTARSDARDARWVRADTWTELAAHVDGLGGDVFPAHVQMIRDVLDVTP